MLLVVLLLWWGTLCWWRMGPSPQSVRSESGFVRVLFWFIVFDGYYPDITARYVFVRGMDRVGGDLWYFVWVDGDVRSTVMGIVGDCEFDE